MICLRILRRKETDGTMKIANSSVSMASTHQLETHQSTKRASIEVNAAQGGKVKSAVAAIYESSGDSMVAAMEQYKKTDRALSPGQEGKTKEQWIEEQKAGLRSYTTDFSVEETADSKLSLLYKLLEALNGKHEPLRIEVPKGGSVLDLRGARSRAAGMRMQQFGGAAFSLSADSPTPSTTSAGTLWQRVTATSMERSESEYTTFQSMGFAVTEDGRSIGFNVEFAMSRAFSEKAETLSGERFVLTDPLIINLSGDTASVSDMKFRFDLDADGEQESISFAGEGSGFLALDANGNGVIDDGSELFGTKSGDGFADLAAYDGDGNGWIDENDAVYSKLRVWTRDADGSDRLLDLKAANVGAIYLGSADTEFSFKNETTHATNGVMRRTGVYLRETGEAGTLSHVDLRC